MLAALAGFVLPVGPGEAMAALWSGSSAAARIAGSEPPEVGERALIGDIVLRYVYPDYTGLAPLEIPNSDGTVHAPPGTRVTITARTAIPFEAAAIQVYERPPTDAELRAGRDLSASLLVEGEGVWRFLLFQGRETRNSPDFKIEVEADAPPVVTTEKGRVEIAVDQAIPLAWQASDDYGLDKVVLEVTQKGRTSEVVLRDPIDVSRALAGQIGKTPRDLGLRPGDEVDLRVSAWDNDPVAGSKKGSSALVKLSVVGPHGRGARLAQYHLALRDALLVALADFLEDPMPPGQDAESMARWGDAARGRLDRVREIVEDQWRGEVPDGIDGVLVQRVLESAARLLRFTQTAFDPSSDRAPSERDLATFADLHAQQVSSLEMAAWMLDSLLRADALQKVAERAEEVADEAAEILELVKSDASNAELLTRLDQLERLMQRLQEESKLLAEGQLREFVNSRSGEARQMISQIRSAISEGRTDEAREMMERLAGMLQQMADGLNEQLASSQETDDALSKRLEQLDQDLGQLGSRRARASRRS
jgi:DNA-binding ferritin-like protein